MENNVIIHRIDDQAWELTDVTREKTLSVLSTIAKGKDASGKMQSAQKIPIRNIARIGNYTNRRARPIRIEFINKPSADFLIQHKKDLPAGIFVDREFNPEIEREHKKL